MRDKMSISFDKEKVIALLKEQGIESDKIDFSSYAADQPIETFLYNNYGITIKGLREQVDDAKAALEKAKLEENKLLKAQSEKLIEEIKTEKAKEIASIKSFKVFRNYIETVIKSKDIHFLVGLGSGGLGKSYCTISTLKELNIDYSYLNAKCTPLSLFEFLYRNNGKILVFDDIIGILDNEISISILMSALWSATDKRIVNYQTTAKIFTDRALPDFFEFTGKIILLTNHLNVRNKYLAALQDRGYFWEFDFSYQDKIAIMKEIVKVDHPVLTLEQRKEVLSYLVKNSSPATKNFSFRTLLKAYNLFAYNKNWRELVRSILIDDEATLFVWKAISEKIKEAWKEFVERGFGCKATYYNIAKKLSKSLSGDGYQ